MEYSAMDLREMDEQTARDELSVPQYERWESIQELTDEAEQTEQALEAEAEAVADITVHADPEALGTRVDVFGNSLLVRVNPENPDLRTILESLIDEAEAHEPDDPVDELEALDDAIIEDLADRLLELLDAALVRWGEVDWQSLSESARAETLADAREAWGLDGLIDAWATISEAVQEDREEKVSTAERFRDAERRGDR